MARQARLTTILVLLGVGLWTTTAFAQSSTRKTTATKAKATTRAKQGATSRPPTRPDATLFYKARREHESLRRSPARAKRLADWRKVIAAYEKVVLQFPRSSYCDDALLLAGQLNEEVARRFKAPRYRSEAVASYAHLVSQYPSSRHAEPALYSSFRIAQASGNAKQMTAAARQYLQTCPDGAHARAVKAALRKSEPAALPSPPPPGLTQVFDVRTWSGDTSTRIVVDLEKKVEIHAERLANPDRLFVDLKGSRIHPNLEKRAFPLGDGLLDQIRLAQNQADVVRVVLDFESVDDHALFFLADPVRLVIDVRGQPSSASARGKMKGEASGPRTASEPIATASPIDWPEGVPSSEGFRPASSPSSPEVDEPVAGPERHRPGQKSAPQPLDGRPVPGLATVPAQPSAKRSPAIVDIPGIRTGAPAPGSPPRSGPPPPPDPAPTPLPTTPEPNRSGSFSLARQLGLAARRIVIDAGHGGHDPGAIGRGGLQEKDVVLDVAKRLARKLREDLRAEVILTRETDVYLPLEERTAIANSRGADLFLSIHANSSRNFKARGIETYFLSFARNAHAEEVVARENAISQATLKDLQGLVKAITLNSKIDESRDFASSVQEALVVRQQALTTVKDRGVHTAPFYVLIGANMPSILAEIAFISNPEDERLLRSPEHRETIADGLFRGVARYFESLNRGPGRPMAASRNPSDGAKAKAAPVTPTKRPTKKAQSVERSATRTSLTRKRR